MQKILWKLDKYYANQLHENPQLFETNLSEMFPRMIRYDVSLSHDKEPVTYVHVTVKEYEDV